MTEQANQVLQNFQIRKSTRQKREFRAWLRRQMEETGYTVTEERGRFSGTNVIVGDREQAELLLTAHYDTQAVLPFPNFITPRSLGWYLAYQMVFVVLLLALAFAAELTVLLLFDPPGWAAPLPVWAVCMLFLWWMFFGKANRHTVNDNTSGVITLLEIAFTLPPEDRPGVCLVFFDNEERGMLGSAAFARRHPSVRQDKLVLNFDCVSDGSSIQFFPTKALKGDAGTLERLERAFLPVEGKTVEVFRGFGFYPSDNASFRRAAGVCALNKHPVFGWYMDRIHTGRDTVFQEENIELLRRGALALAAEDREERKSLDR